MHDKKIICRCLPEIGGTFLFNFFDQLPCFNRGPELHGVPNAVAHSMDYGCRLARDFRANFPENMILETRCLTLVPVGELTV